MQLCRDRRMDYVTVQIRGAAGVQHKQHHARRVFDAKIVDIGVMEIDFISRLITRLDVYKVTTNNGPFERGAFEPSDFRSVRVSRL